MKFIIPRLDLLDMISKIQAIVPQKPAMPVINNVLIDAIDDQLVLSATDFMVSMRTFKSAQVEEPGAIALPAKKFFQLIREITSSQVECHTTSSEMAMIHAGSSHFRMSGINKAEFPEFPQVDEGICLTLPNPMLKEMLVRSSFSAARDDNRQVLNGILFQYKDKTATFIGTDGKRLSRLFAPIEVGEGQGGSCVLPLKAVEEIIKLIDVKDQTTKLTLLPDKICVETNHVILITKLLNGQYPDVDRVIPVASKAPVTLHRDELMALLRQVALFTNEQTSAVRFTFNSGELHLTAMNGEVGEGKVSMVVNYGGPQLEIAFNPNYFIDILKHTKDETVNLSLIDSYNPGLVTDSTNAHFVLMPMRIE
jgi:DNA polymerase-3 subunit beta